MIAELIDKQDTFEIVGVQIAAILASEVASQMALATAGGKDPLDWKMRIFHERSNPWEEFLNIEDDSDVSPLVNVWYDNSKFIKSASNIMERQKTDAIYNIDVYGYGKSSDVEGGGHDPGDKKASLEAQKALRLTRNILMAAEYTYLGLTRGTAWDRWLQSISSFQPQLGSNPIQNVLGARIAFAVSFNEFSPQVPFENIEIIAVTINNESQEVLIEAEYDYT